MGATGIKGKTVAQLRAQLVEEDSSYTDANGIRHFTRCVVSFTSPQKVDDQTEVWRVMEFTTVDASGKPNSYRYITLSLLWVSDDGYGYEKTMDESQGPYGACPSQFLQTATPTAPWFSNSFAPEFRERVAAGKNR